jgi:hypothetical protein
LEKRWNRYARSVGGSWRWHETYIQGKGAGVYPYRAVDQAGKTVDFYASRNREVAAAKAFLRKAMRQPRPPTKITLDADAASHRAVAELKKTGALPKHVGVRSSQYLNHTIEPDHRRVKQQLGSMRGLKSFRTAAGGHQRHRVGGKDLERAVPDRQARRSHGNHAGNLAGAPWLRKQTTPDRRGNTTDCRPSPKLLLGFFLRLRTRPWSMTTSCS